MVQPLPHALLGEFVGTFILVLTVGCAVSAGSFFSVTAIAVALMASIYALGDVSGANFNPAVSVCLGLCGKLEPARVVSYVAIQIMGGLAAGFMGASLCAGDELSNLPSLEYSRPWWAAMLCECLYTAMLCFVVLSVAATKRNQPNNFYGLAIGMSIIAGGYASGRVSGGILNPAVAVGIVPQAAHPSNQWASLPALVGGELLGSLLACAMYYLTHPEEFSLTEDEYYQPGPAASFAAEFIGTFYLVLTVVLNVMDGGFMGAWSIAASLTAMVYSLGCVSGANLNPSVTLGLGLRGALGPHGWCYPGAQLCGGILAAQIAARCLLQQEPIVPMADFPNYSVVRAFGAEMFFTTLLVFAVLCIATVSGKDTRDMTGLIVGSCITGAGYSVGSISGAFLNPAVALGVASAGWFSKDPMRLMQYISFYLVAQLAATGLAVFFFNSTHWKDVPSLESMQLNDAEQGPETYKAAAPAPARASFSPPAGSMSATSDGATLAA